MKRKLLFLGCNYNQIPYLDTLKDRDYEIVGVDLNQNSPGRALCNKFYNVGYDDLDGLIEVGKKEGFTQNDMVFTAAAQFAQKGAAYFAKYFNISYVSEKSIDLCLDKATYYEYFQQNNIPIPPTWYISNEDELKTLISSLDQTKWYYLKSDFSKNPNYVYRFNASYITSEIFFWGRDRYLREFYILQEEFSGISLRLNLYADRFNVIDFITGELTYKYHEQIKNLGILETLRKFLNDIGMQDWLIKFDIILQNEEYVVLDVGMDPPFRMNKESKRQGIDFAKYYIDQYLYGSVDYPLSLD
jgi:hypothetical protein